MKKIKETAAFEHWWSENNDPADITPERTAAWQAWQAAQAPASGADVDTAIELMTVPVRLAPTSYHIVALKAAKADMSVEAFIIRAAMEAKA
jgi:hypothetical protein